MRTDTPRPLVVAPLASLCLGTNAPCDADSHNDGVIDIIDFGAFGTEFGRIDCPV